MSEETTKTPISLEDADLIKKTLANNVYGWNNAADAGVLLAATERLIEAFRLVNSQTT